MSSMELVQQVCPATCVTAMAMVLAAVLQFKPPCPLPLLFVNACMVGLENNVNLLMKILFSTLGTTMISRNSA